MEDHERSVNLNEGRAQQMRKRGQDSRTKTVCVIVIDA